jgi:hypothetical protein
MDRPPPSPGKDALPRPTMADPSRRSISSSAGPWLAERHDYKAPQRPLAASASLRCVGDRRGRRTGQLDRSADDVVRVELARGSRRRPRISRAPRRVNVVLLPHDARTATFLARRTCRTRFTRPQRRPCRCSAAWAPWQTATWLAATHSESPTAALRCRSRVYALDGSRRSDPDSATHAAPNQPATSSHAPLHASRTDRGPGRR